jgi:hypothetical protein
VNGEETIVALGVPQPPTDSLYKFLALSGVVILALSLYFPDELASQIQQKESEYRTRIAVTMVRVDHAKRRVTEIAQYIDDAMARQKGTYQPDSDKLELAFSNTDLKNLLDRQSTTVEDLQVSIEESKGLQNQIAELKSRATFLRRLGVVGCVVGGIIALVGFILWYLRIQRFDDRVARTRA